MDTILTGPMLMYKILILVKLYLFKNEDYTKNVHIKAIFIK